MDYVVEDMKRQDWAQVRTIYGEGLATGLAAFRLTPPKWDDWNANYLLFARFVAREKDGGILGWAALAPVPDT